MAVRASGGRVAVRVHKEPPAPLGSMREYLARKRGAWWWSVPIPKGHPRTPPLGSLSGVARTQPEAVAAGLRRLAQVYGLPPV